MKAAIRMALACFNMFGLQNWLHAISAVLLLVAAVLALTADPGESSAAGGFGVAAVTLALLIPGYGGGLALRHVLSLNTTQLRPYGRERVLAGATLAITLLAGIATIPTLIAHVAELGGARDALARATPMVVFAGAWAATATIWMFCYLTSSSPRTYFLLFLIPIVMPQFSRTIAPLLPSTFVMMAIAAACWMALLVWIRRAGVIRNTTFQGLFRNSDPMGLGNNAGTIKYELFPFEPASRTTAIRHYLLGTPSWWGPVLMGVAMLLMVAMIALLAFSRREDHSDVGSPMGVLGMFVFMGPSVAFMLVRRARLLWLRAGANRDELFRIAEQQGLLMSMIALGTLAAGLVVWALVLRPDLISSIPACLLASLMFSVAAFYAFFSFTRGLNTGDVLLGIALGISMVVHVVMTRPDGGSIRNSLTLLIIWAALAPLLRWHAQRRWRGLDWRVAMPIVTPTGRPR